MKKILEFINENCQRSKLEFILQDDEAVIDYAKKSGIYDMLIKEIDIERSNIIITRNTKDAFVFRYDFGHVKAEDNGFSLIIMRDIDNEIYVRLNLVGMAVSPVIGLGFTVSK